MHMLLPHFSGKFKAREQAQARKTRHFLEVMLLQGRGAAADHGACGLCLSSRHERTIGVHTSSECAKHRKLEHQQARFGWLQAQVLCEHCT